MIGILRKPKFWTHLIAAVFSTFFIANLAFGWSSPAANPPTASGPVYIDGSGNVGIGVPAPAQRLDIAGNVSWSGSLMAGSVPWARLAGFPGAVCPVGQFVTSLPNGVVTCAAFSCANLSAVGDPGGLYDCTDNPGAAGVSQVSAGFGIIASPSPITTTGTLSVDPTQVQQAVVVSTCPTWAYGITQAGALLCR